MPAAPSTIALILAGGRGTRLAAQSFSLTRSPATGVTWGRWRASTRPTWTCWPQKRRAIIGSGAFIGGGCVIHGNPIAAVSERSIVAPPRISPAYPAVSVGA